MKLLITVFFFFAVFLTNSQAVEVISLPAGTHLEAAVLISQNSACLVGDDEIRYLDLTTGMSAQVFFRTNSIIRDVCFSAGTQTGYAVGYDWSNNSPIILKTTNGGLNWQETVIPGYQHNPYSLCISNDTIAIAGSDGSLARSIDGGTSWQVNTSFNCWFFTNEDIILKDNYIFVTANKLFRSNDAGINWLQVGLLDSTASSGISFSGLTKVGNTLFGAGGELGTPHPAVAYTTDNGTTWQQTVMADTGWLSSIKFANATHGFAAGYQASGQVYPVAYETTDGGVHWTKMSLNMGPAQSLIDIFTDQTNVYLVGGDYILVQPLIMTGVGEENSAPQNFHLSQNYPNPFNPSTKINFSIAKAGVVNLRVFDITGKEVAVLINDVKPAGTYTVEFKDARLASGTYFYKLESSGFVETKRMMLLK